MYIYIYIYMYIYIYNCIFSDHIPTQNTPPFKSFFFVFVFFYCSLCK